MAADISVLTRNYRRLAKIAGGTDLARQKQWLQDRFVAEDEGGTAEATGISKEGSGSQWQHRGSTPEERMSALEAAIIEVEAEITAAATDEAAPGRVGCLIPRVICAPH